MLLRSIILGALPLSLLAQSSATAVTPEKLFELRRFDEARAAFEGILAKDKNDANALFYLGRIAEAQGKSGDAVDWYEKAVKRDDKNALYHFYLGSAVGTEAQKANKLRQPFLARRVKSEFERSVQLDPNLIDPRFGLVDFYSIAPGIMGGSMDKAREQAAEIGKLNAMRGHEANARIANRVKDTITVEKEWRAAITVAPDSARGYSGLATFYRGRGRYDEAAAVYDEWMKARPNDATPHANWGIVAVLAGKNLERAERELKYWFEHYPKDTPPAVVSGIHFRLAQLYEKQSRKDLARAEYEEAVKLNPDNQDAKKALAALK